MIVTFLAVIALPTGKTALVPGGRAGVVSELVVPGTAEGGTRGVVVVRLAQDSHPVGHGRSSSRVSQSVPLGPGLHDARPPGLLDQSALF